MRWVFCSLFALTLASPAVAADFEIPPPAPVTDYDVLRGSVPVGPATFTRWSGFYAGGQIGLSDANADFSSTTQSLVAYALRATTLESQQAPSQWPVLGNADQGAIGYGAFVGYNTQWEDLILGIEANFNRASFSLHASTSPIARSRATARAAPTASVSLATARLPTRTSRRSGCGPAGSPAIFCPTALSDSRSGVANTNVSATGVAVQYTSGTVGVCTVSKPCGSASINNGFNANSQVLYGFTVGGGVDVALMQNVFLRAEFEFDQFNPPPASLDDRRHRTRWRRA